MCHCRSTPYARSGLYYPGAYARYPYGASALFSESYNLYNPYNFSYYGRSFFGGTPYGSCCGYPYPGYY